MPIENERKFVLENDGRLEPLLGQAPGVVRSILVQAYLDAPGLRLRGIETDGKLRHIFGYKREVAGNVVEIEHLEAFTTRYAHLNKRLVSVGQVVQRQEKIGELGNTGRSTGPHLHYEVLRHGRAINPSAVLPKVSLVTLR